MTTLYPWGYQKLLVPLDELKQRARIDLMEPEAAERMFSWVVSRGGEVGIGGAVRFFQPDLPGFAPSGMSFHELQLFFDGTKWFMALDLVVRNGDDIHRSPTWSEVPKQGSGHPDIVAYGVHCNVNGEPWHMQLIEFDGWQTWVNNGRKRPNQNFPIKDVQEEPTPAAGDRTLRVETPRMRGDDVLVLQKTLKNQGLTVELDGVYGPDTAEKVKIMQGWNGMVKTGVVGPQVWALVSAYNAAPDEVPNPTLHPVGSRTLRLAAPPMQGDDVRWVQNVLKDQGLTISVDSIYNLQTMRRVKIVQGWNGLTEDGVVGPKTFEVLKKY